jgi:hypothetical protein
MAEAKRDGNFVTTLLGTSNADGTTPLVVYVDSSTNRLLVSSTGTVEETGHAAVGTFRKTVTTAGMAEQLSSNACKIVHIQALSDNEDAVQVGDSNTIATSEATQRGFRLFPTQAIDFIVSNTNLIYVDAAVNDDGISVVFEN